MTVVTFSSLKGGVGKSTCAILCATNLTTRGHKVLVLDLDRNNSATMFFTAGIENIENEIASKNMFEALSHNSINNYIILSRIENIAIVPSSLHLPKIRTLGFNELRKSMTDIDFVFIKYHPPLIF